MGLKPWLAMLVATVVAGGVSVLLIPYCLTHPWPVSNPRLDAQYGFPFKQRGPVLLTPLLVDLAGAFVIALWLGSYFWLTGLPEVVRYRPARGERRRPTG